jgi:hypothetical protein
MNALTQKAIEGWARLGPRFLPFADAATPDLPLSRLLRLSLFQVSVGMALVLLIGTLNRVMIVELGVSAGLVGTMISLPLIFAPFRALIGFRSDTHTSALGWRRTMARSVPPLRCSLHSTSNAGNCQLPCRSTAAWKPLMAQARSPCLPPCWPCCGGGAFARPKALTPCSNHRTPQLPRATSQT